MHIYTHFVQATMERFTRLCFFYWKTFITFSIVKPQAHFQATQSASILKSKPTASPLEISRNEVQSGSFLIELLLNMLKRLLLKGVC